MAERTTKVTLTAQVAGYVQGMEKAAQATRKTSTEAEKLGLQAEKMQALGRASLAVGTLAAVGVGLAVKKYADFDKAMSSVQAATLESSENMGILRDAALQAGADTAFSATEAAGAVEELAKAGVATTDILNGGLRGALDLAAAGQLAVGDAAEIAASALTQFNLKGTDVPHVADLLAAGAGKAQGSVEDMGAALGQAGLVASQMGLSIEDTTGTLAAFASAGLVGSDAGTSFRAMLLRLANPTEEVKTLMADLGIEAYNTAGDFVGIESLAGQLQDRLGGLTQAQRDSALALIFGQDAIRGANVLYKQGAQGIADWTGKVDESGYAAKTAEARMDNLAGDLEKLGGAFDTALIKTGSAANDVLRGIVQTAEGAVDAFANAPQGVQTTTLFLGGLTAAVGIAGGSFLLAVPKIAAFKAALATMSPGAQRAAGVLGKIGKAAGIIAGLGAAVVILDKLANGADRAAPGVERVLKALSENDIDGAFVNASDSADSFAEALELVAGSGFDANMERFGEALGGPLGLTGVVSDARSGFESLDAALAQLVGAGNASEAERLFAEIGKRAKEQGIDVDKLKELFPDYAEALAGASNAQGDAADTADELSGGLDDVGSAADDARQQVSDLAEMIRGFGDTQLSVNDANRQVEQSLDDFKASLEENGVTLDITTEKGRANQSALDDIARAYQEAAAATVENTGKQEDAIPVIEEGRQAVVDAGQAAGLSKEQAEAYADSLGLIPSDVETAIRANWDEAILKAQAVAQAIRDIPGQRDIVINEQVQQTGAARGLVGAAFDGSANGNLFAYASGGFASGIYAGRPGAIHKFAEPETRWEAYVSGKPGQESRNRGILLEAWERLGGSVATAAPAAAQPGGPSMGMTNQLLRELKSAVEQSLRVPVGAVQGSLGVSNVSSTVTGRGI